MSMFADMMEKRPTRVIGLSATAVLVMCFTLLASVSLSWRAKTKLEQERAVSEELRVHIQLLRDELKMVRAEECSPALEQDFEELTKLKQGKTDLEGKLKEITDRLEISVKEKKKLITQIEDLNKDRRMLAKKLGFKLAGGQA